MHAIIGSITSLITTVLWVRQQSKIGSIDIEFVKIAMQHAAAIK